MERPSIGGFQGTARQPDTKPVIGGDGVAVVHHHHPAPLPPQQSPPQPSHQGQQQQQQQQGAAGRKKGTACARCRSQKVRCDDGVPSCANCTKAGQPCVRAKAGNNAEAIGYIVQIEARMRSLEDSLRRIAPEELDKAPRVDTSAYEHGGDHSAAYSAPTPPVMEPNPWQRHTPPGGRHSESIGDLSTVASSSFHHHGSPAAAGPGGGAGISSPSAVSTQIKPSEPLAHEVGLLSLANSRDSKYLGPSSGVSLARLIFANVPQSQGLRSTIATAAGHSRNRPAKMEAFPKQYTSEVDLQNFVDIYFETYQPLYPFLDEDAMGERLEKIFTQTQQQQTQQPTSTLNGSQMPPLGEIEAMLSPFLAAQFYLIVALGAKILEGRLGKDFSSERYLATAMVRIDKLALHDSFEGVQIMLLLVLSSFSFENGPNAWFLSATIVASCLDLGLQRKLLDPPPNAPRQTLNNRRAEKHIRSGIFWSAYSFERQLCVVLGRPLSLRDEAIDVEFPGTKESTNIPETVRKGTSFEIPDDGDDIPQHQAKRARIGHSPYTAAQYSFSFDRITAEIKLNIHRVCNNPICFPWPRDFPEWQQRTQDRCDELLNGLMKDLKWRSRRSSVSDSAIRALELKYHNVLLLLHRPSPAIKQPSFTSISTCYNSAMKIILIYAELQRFSKLTNTWYTAHTIFVSGITYIWCIWVSTRLQADTTPESFTNVTTACTDLLKYIGKSWSVAADAHPKYERLVQVALKYCRLGQEVEDQNTHMAAGESLMYLSQGQQAMQPNSMPGRPMDGPVPPLRPGGGFDAQQPMQQQPPPPTAYMGDPTQPVPYDWDSDFPLTELGDMSMWFDLNWLPGGNFMTGDMGFYPA